MLRFITIAGLALILASGCLGRAELPSEPKPPPDTRPRKTAEVQLLGQQRGQHPRAYTATFGERGHLLKLEVPPDTKAIVYFIRKGYASKDCPNLNATVPIYSGQSTTHHDVKLIFGTHEPVLPVTVSACLGIEPVPDRFSIRAVYTEQ